MTPAIRKSLKLLPPVLGLLVLAGIISGLHGALKHVRPQDVLNAMGAISPVKWCTPSCCWAPRSA